MAELASMHRYESYKSSGVDWLGKTPIHWDIVPLKYVLDLVSDKTNSKTSDLHYIGMENVESWTGKIKAGGAEVEGLASKFKKNDILFGKLRPYLAKVTLAKFNGICSTEFLVYRVISYSNFYRYFLGSELFISLVDSSTYGSKMPRASSDFIGNQKIVVPTDTEKELIAKFLDKKTAQIDEAITIKEKQIELLKERKQIIIQQAVIQGLNPDAPMKDSGFDWIGEIPDHWQLKRLKYVLDERNERSKTGEEPLFMMSQIHGLVVRADYHAKAEVSASNVDNKIVYKNDLVFNKLKAHLGVFFKSNIDFKGLVSPDYAVYEPKAYIADMRYLEVLFRHPRYIEQFIIRATGIVEGLIRLYTDDLFDIAVPIAPEEEQVEILKYIDTESKKFDTAIKLQVQQIVKLKEYKITLINSAVTGKIKVPEVDSEIN